MVIPPPVPQDCLGWGMVVGLGGDLGGSLAVPGPLITRGSTGVALILLLQACQTQGFELKEGSSLTVLVEEVLPAVWDLPSPSDPPGPKNLAGITPPSRTYTHIPAVGCNSAI